MKWQAIVTDENQRSALAVKLGEIVDTLQKKSKSLQGEGLMGGKIGIAPFFFYYARYTQNQEYYDFGFELISDTFDAINNGFSYHTFAGGLAGIGWTITHLLQAELLELDSDEVLDALTPYLSKTMMMDMGSGNYDYLHGALGTGLYFISQQNKDSARQNLTQLLADLAKHAQKEEGGALKWEATLDHEKGTRGFNLSLSHGLASIIVFLARTWQAGIAKQQASDLLAGAVQYLCKNQHDPKHFNSYFPSWIQEGEEASKGSRLAWCYGDLGISTALLQAARIIGNKTWEKLALDAASLTTKCRDLEESGVVDAGLCHGTAGNAHIYNRLYHYTEELKYKESALYWLDETLKQARFDNGLAGFKAWHTEKYGGWTDEQGLLEGIAGIGLTFLAAISDNEPNWDRSLLLS